jgi:hypothetical protein
VCATTPGWVIVFITYLEREEFWFLRLASWGKVGQKTERERERERKKEERERERESCF